MIPHLQCPVLAVCADDEYRIRTEPIPTAVKIQVPIQIVREASVVQPVQYPPFATYQVTASFSRRQAGGHGTVQAGHTRLFGTVG